MKPLRTSVVAVLAAAMISTFGATAAGAHAPASPTSLAAPTMMLQNSQNVTVPVAVPGEVTTVEIPGDTSFTDAVIETSLGAGFSLAVTDAGELYSWGSNSYGQLGIGSTETAIVPTLVGVSDVLTMSAGKYHSLAVTTSGAVYSWGYNYNGALGDCTFGKTDPEAMVATSPVRIDGYFASDIEPGETIVQVEAGAYHSHALTSTGRLFSWGYNSSGQLGTGDTTDLNVPTLVDLERVEGLESPITELSSSGNFSLALTESGQVFSWGNDDYGQLGNGPDVTGSVLTPTLVSTPNQATVTEIAAGFYHSLALTSAGSLLGWGYNHYGQVGDGSTTDAYSPVQIALPGNPTISSIGVGDCSSFAVTENGAVFAWGANYDGQLGYGETHSYPDSYTPRLTVVSTADLTTQIAGGEGHTAIITSAGVTKLFGSRSEGKIGDGIDAAPATEAFIPTEPRSLLATGVTLKLGSDTLSGEVLRKTAPGTFEYMIPEHRQFEVCETVQTIFALTKFALATDAWKLFHSPEPPLATQIFRESSDDAREFEFSIAQPACAEVTQITWEHRSNDAAAWVVVPTAEQRGTASQQQADGQQKQITGTQAQTAGAQTSPVFAVSDDGTVLLATLSAPATPHMQVRVTVANDSGSVQALAYYSEAPVPGGADLTPDEVKIAATGDQHGFGAFGFLAIALVLAGGLAFSLRCWRGVRAQA